MEKYKNTVIEYSENPLLLTFQTFIPHIWKYENISLIFGENFSVCSRMCLSQDIWAAPEKSAKFESKSAKPTTLS